MLLTSLYLLHISHPHLPAPPTDIYEEEISIDPKLHNTLIGAKGRIIRSIIDESGSVQVRFPSADNPSEKVSIRGSLSWLLICKLINKSANEGEMEVLVLASYHLR